MSRMRGFTLIEILLVSTILAASSAAIAGVIHQMRKEDRLAADYAADLRGMRKALQRLERDLSAAHKIEGRTIDGVHWKLIGGELLRGDEVVATRIAEFSIKQTCSLAEVTLALAPRSASAARRARVVTTVNARGLGHGR